jgi:NADH-quinone oxidoreductase subunit N
MNAPFVWILLPLFIAGILLLIRNENVIIVTAGFLTLFLTLAAWLVPLDSALTIGSLTINISSTLQILGRQFTLTSGDRSFLALVYGSAFFWFIPAATLQIVRRIIPLGLALTALLVAAIAVEPFLYAALIIEMAVLLSLPLLSTPGQKPGKGLLRFLIFQTLAVPFILFSGWVLAGIEANPGNVTLVKQAAIFLGFGFAFLLAIFPFYTWIPLLSEEVHPFILGYVLWILPTVTLFFAMGFLEHYSWLRDAAVLGSVLRLAGILMVVSGGILAAFQRHLGRMMGYAIIFETGFSLLALSLVNKTGINIFLLLLVPRALCLAVWSLSLSVLKDPAPGLLLTQVKGIARKWPFGAVCVIFSNLALAGLPLLAMFPIHNAIWEELAKSSLVWALWVFIGSVGLSASAIRVLTAFISSSEGTPWHAFENTAQKVFLSLGLAAMLLLGIFPQWVLPLWSKLPALFSHLGQ